MDFDLCNIILSIIQDVFRWNRRYTIRSSDFEPETTVANTMEVDVNINKDRVSELPNNLIESILERISTKEAARTSILSTKWRYIWTTMPKLVLDKQFFEELRPKMETELEPSQFVEIVDSILMVHNGPIQKFDIYIEFAQTRNMDLWIQYLSRNGVKELTFYNSYTQSYKLPSDIFSCDKLTYLSLYDCVLNTPLEFTGFCNLTKLYLEKIFLSNNTGSLISTLPLLHSLSLRSCTGVENVKNLPRNLSWFVIINSHEVQRQWFQRNTKLQVLFIYLGKEVKKLDVQGKIFALDYFLSDFPNLQTLWLDGFTLKFLAAGVFTEFHQLSHKLKEIKLYYLRFIDLDQVSLALCLLKSSPNLEKLEIKAFSVLNDGLVQQDLSYIVGKADLDLKLNHLRTATLSSFSGLETELGFVKLILSHSPLLEQIVIESKYGMAADKELSISTQLMRFRRASVKSEIIYTRSQSN